jgi:hypothetical protein
VDGGVSRAFLEIVRRCLSVTDSLPLVVKKRCFDKFLSLIRAENRPHRMQNARKLELGNGAGFTP